MANRRKWIDDLRPIKSDEENNKKINVLNEQIYIDGKLVKETNNTERKYDSIKHVSKFQYSSSNDSDWLAHLPLTPHLRKRNVNSLTPTFRSPNSYIRETRKVLKKLTPQKLTYAPSQMEDLGTCEIEHELGSIDFNELIDFHDFKNVNDNNSSLLISVSVDHLSENNNVPRTPSPQPGTSDEPVTYRAASVPRSPSPRPGTSDEPVTYRAASVPRSPSPRPGTSDEPVTYRAASVPRSPSPRPGTSDEQSRDVPSKRQPKRKVKRDHGTKPSFDESYIDFVLDKEDRDTLLLNEAFPSEDSDDWNTSVSDESDEMPKKKKKRKQHKNNISAEKNKPKTQIKKENKKNKNLGKCYKNSKGIIVEEKAMKPNPCANTKCSNRCGEISEERRDRLFSHFWKLESMQRRRDWIAQITEKNYTKSSSVNEPEASRRKFTYTYFINEGEGRRKVCQKFLIDTLDITQKFILYTVTHKIDGFAKSDERGKNVSHNKTPPEILKHVKSFILSLPLLPSHYCRKGSQKLYLQEEIKNITNLYSVYVENCKQGETKPISLKVFSAYFKQNFNIGFHVPKKDKCVLCSAKTYDVLTKEEIDKMNAHLQEKEYSYNRFIFHQNLNTKDKSVICASFDLQKVLNTPHGKNMSLYYSRKISVYNFTIYESGTQEGFCHIWNETDAHRGANEIATILLNYIKEVDSRGCVKTLLLYADSCYGQNKNKTVLSMLRYALANSQNLEVIQINFLVPGHTYMPVDSMHAVIERSIKDTMIWAPSHWPTVIALSRKNPFPYKVVSMEGKQFKGFEDIINKTFKKTEKLMISTISVATLKKNNLNKMFVKRSMSAEAECTEITLHPFQRELSPKDNLYPNKLPISAQKYEDLKKLTKKVIPAAYANEYLGLKYNSKTVDCLPDTDEEDNV